MTKIAVVQFNPTVGDLEANYHEIIRLYDVASVDGKADIVIFPECALTGYPIEDLVLRESFMDAVHEYNNLIKKHVWRNRTCTKLIYGTPVMYEDGRPRNCAYYLDPLLQLRRLVAKQELPNYGVFDEKRVFAAGDDQRILITPHGNIGLMICEDCWFPAVSEELAAQGADLLISINGSPFEMGKNVVRRQVIANRIKETGVPFLYVNMVGGQDELVFDGGSFLYDGKEIQEAPHFEDGVSYFYFQAKSEEEITIQAKIAFNAIPPYDDEREWDEVGTNTQNDWKRKVSRISLDNYPTVQPTGIKEVYQAMVLGTRDYLRKTGTKSVVLGYSGGVDSGLVAAIACDAIGHENVLLVRLPSKFSSEGSLTDAAEGAKRLGASMRTILIEPIVDSLRYAYAQSFVQNTPDAWEPGDKWPRLTGVADENIQARARGNILMAISNQEGHMVLTTGNKSEVSVGYATLYGDMSGGFNPIKDAYKTTVWELCRWRNGLTSGEIRDLGFKGATTEVVPEAIISKPPSAELRANQQDTDSLPPYDVLDAILKGLIERERSVKDMVAEGFAEDVVRRVRNLVDNAEYKRRQAAPGIKITSKIHGRDRRYPIVNKWRG